MGKISLMAHDFCRFKVESKCRKLETFKDSFREKFVLICAIWTLSNFLQELSSKKHIRNLLGELFNLKTCPKC